MKKTTKAVLWSLFGGLGFLMISGDLGLTIAMIVLINYLEFRNFR